MKIKTKKATIVLTVLSDVYEGMHATGVSISEFDKDGILVNRGQVCNKRIKACLDEILAVHADCTDEVYIDRDNPKKWIVTVWE